MRIYFLLYAMIFFNFFHCQTSAHGQTGHNWTIMPTEYLSSYGDECSILVFKDHSVLRDVISIEPSLETVLNNFDTTNIGSATKIVAQISLKKLENSEILQIVEGRFKIYSESDKIDDSKLENDLIRKLNSVNIELLKSQRERAIYTFGVVFVKKQ